MDITFVGASNQVCKNYLAHNHDCWEIMYNAHESGLLTAADNTYAFNPGDIAIIPPGILHKKQSEGDFTESSLFFRVFLPIGEPSFRIVQDDAQQSVAKLMDIAAIYSNPSNVYEHALLNAVMDQLYQALVVQYATGQPMDHKLRQVVEDMRDNITNPDFDLSASVAASGYCAGYFRKLFKAHTKQSPVEYMQTLRINYARSLIDRYGSSRSVKEIARSSGFQDPLYFSRVFKKVTGISPKEYGQGQLAGRTDRNG